MLRWESASYESRESHRPGTSARRSIWPVISAVRIYGPSGCATCSSGQPAMTPSAATRARRAAGDAEATVRRQFEVPVIRSFSATARVSASAGSSDAALDRIAGYHGPIRAMSASRFGLRPGVRASAALDGDPATAWIGDYRPGRPAWISWHANRASVIGSLRLLAPREPVRRAERRARELAGWGKSSSPGVLRRRRFDSHVGCGRHRCGSTCSRHASRAEHRRPTAKPSELRRSSVDPACGCPAVPVSPPAAARWCCGSEPW